MRNCEEPMRALTAWDMGTIAIGDTVVSALVDTPSETGTITELVGAPYAPGAEVTWANGRVSYWMLAELNIVNKCGCCDATLHEIDPENICMDCVDMECNVKDENNE